MRLTWYGTACLTVEAGGTLLAFDPFLKFPNPGQEPPEARALRAAALGRCRRVFVTHGHIDHLHSAREIYLDTPAEFYLTASPARHLLRQGFPAERLHIVEPGQSVALADARVAVYRARHIHFDWPLIRSRVCAETLRQPGKTAYLLASFATWPEAGEIVAYCVEAEGKRLLIFGSAGLDAGECYPVGVDALVLPHQGRSNITEVCTDITRRIAPKQVFLDHYDNAYPPLTRLVDCGAYCDRVRALCRAEPLAEGEPVEINL